MQKELFCRFRTGGLILFYNFIMLCIKNDYFVQMNTTYSKALFFWSKTLSNYCLFSAIYFVRWLIFMAKQNEQKKMFFIFFCCSLADAVCSPRIMQFIFFRLFLICFFFTYYYCHTLILILFFHGRIFILFFWNYTYVCAL